MVLAAAAFLVSLAALWLSRRATRASERSAAESGRSADAANEANALTRQQAAERAHRDDAPVFEPALATFGGGTTAQVYLRLIAAPTVLSVNVKVDDERWLGFAAGDSGFSTSDALFDEVRVGETVGGTLRFITQCAANEPDLAVHLVVQSESQEQQRRQWRQDYLVTLVRGAE